ncbi:16S rRNA (uracil(1498)-N(3))-methyltransferase [Halomonas elongata]|uniref:Ribosomal RNA small subunit methyltransferase E n=1 Tax=Halomonas elongata (strain ATCC 33173 / DSM 2581 / NBRC 15536 / NCIMB 2198 / 1H9) TaxID=768066 RepID=E1V479_HALED|nr:16S rRNA (uracil(1498)-N(3))-methyltransferase [Halomonas elongata]WBF18158.1 16S rRNA (uracil(1498)-N(3))-methyltransferase [Halomonas elongata]WPU47009.1 16S rRNA (uracil(1498)-N(3))-methyltransferase [Halomonas elongata DSM 2581]CBV40916.1 16S rRNA (uracil(1498)-N(3))-methyltransferase RsmE [Halomonas elongata DSM 2581]
MSAKHSMGKAPRIHVAAELQAGGDVVLPDGAARHVARVLRLGPGAPVIIFDGQGNEAEAILTEAGRKQVVARVERVAAGRGESPLAVHLGQAISKGDRMDYAIQKAVELGVAEITPLYTEHGDVRLKGEREAKKLAHWQAVAASACEQCGRATLPPVYPPRSVVDWLAERDEPLCLVLHPGTPGGLDRHDDPVRAALLIGPEGGLSHAEVDAAADAGFASLTLGPRILRTETAPVVALSLLQNRFGDL